MEAPKKARRGVRMKRGLSLFIGIVAVLMLVIALGPRPPVDETIRFEAAGIGRDIDAWLADRESRVEGLKPGTEKEIVWADPQSKEKTPLSFIYVHGFSATKWETRPVSDRVAEAFGANLFYTRLTGHGADGEALAQASMNDWVNDMAEAIAIGERTGERIVIIAMSSGATLATWASGNARLMSKVAGLVLMSANYEVQGASLGLLNMPWGSTLLPLAFGETRSWEPHNAEQAKWWTTSYPSASVLTLAALMKTVSLMNPAEATTPALFICSPKDTVTVPKAAEEVYKRWGAPKKLIQIEETGDPSNHVLAGDILSPGNTDRVVADIVAWVNTLER